MNDKEIKNNFEKLLENVKEYLDYGLPYNEYIYLENTIKAILDLYNKEKEKNKTIVYNYEQVVDKLEIAEKSLAVANKLEEEIKEKFVNKDKIKEKIEEIEDKIHVVIPNEYNKMEVMNEFKNEGAINVLKELLEK